MNEGLPDNRRVNIGTEKSEATFSAEKKAEASRLKTDIEHFRENFFMLVMTRDPGMVYGNEEQKTKAVGEYKASSREKEILTILEGNNDFSKFVKGAESFDEVIARANLHLFELTQGDGLVLGEIENIRAHALAIERYESIPAIDAMLVIRHENMSAMETASLARLLELSRAYRDARGELKDVTEEEIRSNIMKTIRTNPERLSLHDWGQALRVVNADADYEQWKELNKLWAEHSLDAPYKADELINFFDEAVANQNFERAHNLKKNLYAKIDRYEISLKGLAHIFRFADRNHDEDESKRSMYRIRERTDKNPIAMSDRELMEMSYVATLLEKKYVREELEKEIKKRKPDYSRAYELELKGYEVDRGKKEDFGEVELLLSTKDKPPFLYHGTINEDIEEFEPRSAPERPEEDPAVYASPDLDIATQSMANKFVSNGGIVDGIKFVCIPMTREEFMREDKGGTVYVLPNNSFNMNNGLGLGEKEWISKTPVKPIKKIKFPSLLEKMIAQGTRVYFIKPEMIPIITQAQDGDPQELKNTLRGLESEQVRLLREKGEELAPGEW